MIRLSALTTAVLVTSLSGAVAQTAAPAAKRQLDAHEHGAAKLAIAMEGTKVTMELDVPGDDIVGFESEAKTPKQKAAVEAAIKTLSNPTALFVLTAAAGCTTTDAKVEVKTSAAGHNEFEGAYTLTCTAPDKIADLQFAFFKLFPKAEKVTVTLLSPKGQKQFTATPKKPKVTLTGAV